MPKEGNFPSCASDQEKSDVLPSPPKEKSKSHINDNREHEDGEGYD